MSRESPPAPAPPYFPFSRARNRSARIKKKVLINRCLLSGLREAGGLFFSRGDRGGGEMGMGNVTVQVAAAPEADGPPYSVKYKGSAARGRAGERALKQRLVATRERSLFLGSLHQVRGKKSQVPRGPSTSS